jgi:two-component system KDP operon response regulator KdpE
MPDKARILVIEDETPIRRFLRASLGAHGFEFIESENAKDGIHQAATRQPDLIVLDLGLPDLDGIEVIKQVREWSTVPIIVLSARGQEKDKVAALDAGADDYLTKPFGVAELLARVRVALRHAVGRASETEGAIFEVQSLRVDLGRRLVTVNNGEVRLTPIEYRLLTTLVKHAGKVVTHRQLLNDVWGPHSTRETHYLRVYMGHLRHKIEADPARPRILLTEPGIGYRLAGE